MADAVSRLGALQAQDYAASLWAVGLRTGRTELEVEAAIERREIVRTWPMRGTLHLVSAGDAGWMVQYLAPRVIASARGRARYLGLEEETFAAARRLFTRLLRDGGSMTRPECYAALASTGIDPAGQRGIHILSRLAMESLLCLGPRREKQPTFVLLADWVPHPNRLARDEALHLLASRYFGSHGPASVEDFSWWSGMPLSEARGICADVGLETVGSWNGKALYASQAGPSSAPSTARVRLLAAFDEYLLGYRDRSACLSAALDRYVTKNGVFLATIVVDGEIAGVWRRRRTRAGVTVRCEPFRPFDDDAVAGAEAEAQRFASFVEAPVRVEWLPG